MQGSWSTVRPSWLIKPINIVRLFRKGNRLEVIKHKSSTQRRGRWHNCHKYNIVSSIDVKMEMKHRFSGQTNEHTGFSPAKDGSICALTSRYPSRRNYPPNPESPLSFVFASCIPPKLRIGYGGTSRQWHSSHAFLFANSHIHLERTRAPEIDEDTKDTNLSQEIVHSLIMSAGGTYVLFWDRAVGALSSHKVTKHSIEGRVNGVTRAIFL